MDEKLIEKVKRGMWYCYENPWFGCEGCPYAGEFEQNFLTGEKNHCSLYEDILSVIDQLAKEATALHYTVDGLLIKLDRARKKDLQLHLSDTLKHGRTRDGEQVGIGEFHEK